MKFNDDAQQQSLGFGNTWKTFYDLVFTMDKDRREGIMEILDKYDEQPQATVKKPSVKKGAKKSLNKKSLFAKWGQVAEKINHQVKIDINDADSKEKIENPKEQVKELGMISENAKDILSKLKDEPLKDPSRKDLADTLKEGLRKGLKLKLA